MPKLKRMHHIGIAVQDLEATTDAFKDALGLEPEESEEIEDQKVKTTSFHIGEAVIEFLQATSKESAIARYIRKRGPGIHHVCFEVDDIKGTLEEFKRRGVSLVDVEPRVGAGNRLVAFLHPKSTGGVLIELSQKR